MSVAQSDRGNRHIRKQIEHKLISTVRKDRVGTGEELLTVGEEEEEEAKGAEDKGRRKPNPYLP